MNKSSEDERPSSVGRAEDSLGNECQYHVDWIDDKEDSFEISFTVSGTKTKLKQIDLNFMPRTKEIEQMEYVHLSVVDYLRRSVIE